MHIIEITNTMPSAIGTANHTPFVPQISGSVKRHVVTKPNVLRKESTVDIFPFDKAVNIEDANIFNPQNKKLQENILKPVTES